MRWLGVSIVIETNTGHRCGTASQQRGHAEYQATFHTEFLLGKHGHRLTCTSAQMLRRNRYDVLMRMSGCSGARTGS